MNYSILNKQAVISGQRVKVVIPYFYALLIASMRNQEGIGDRELVGGRRGRGLPSQMPIPYPLYIKVTATKCIVFIYNIYILLYIGDIIVDRVGDKVNSRIPCEMHSVSL
jgi:hypothetical protein